MPFFGPTTLGGGDDFANVPPVPQDMSRVPLTRPVEPGPLNQPPLPINTPPPFNAGQPGSSTSPITNQPPLAFAGPTSGRAESITAQIGGDSHSPVTAIGTPATGSSAGSTVSGPTVSGHDFNQGPLTGLINDVVNIQNATLVSQLAGKAGINPTLANIGVGVAGQMMGVPLGLANFFSGMVGPAPNASPATVAGLMSVVNALEGFLNEAMASPTIGAQMFSDFPEEEQVAPAAPVSTGQNVGMGSPEAGVSINTETGAITTAGIGGNPNTVTGQSLTGGVPSGGNPDASPSPSVGGGSAEPDGSTANSPDGGNASGNDSGSIGDAGAGDGGEW